MIKQWNRVVCKASVLGPRLSQILRPVTQHWFDFPEAPPPPPPPFSPMLLPAYLGLPTPSSHSNTRPAPQLMEDHKAKQKEKPRVFYFFRVTVSPVAELKCLRHLKNGPLPFHPAPPPVPVRQLCAAAGPSLPHKAGPLPEPLGGVHPSGSFFLSISNPF